MRLGGRLQAAIEVLEDMARRHRPASEALKDWGLSHRFAGSGDRAGIGNIVYDALRRRRSAGRLLGADSPRAQAFGALLLEGGYTADRLDGELLGDGFAPPSLTLEERASIAQGLAGAPPAVQGDLPDWCEPLFRESFGDDWTAQAIGLARRPPLDLRVNTLKAERPKLLRTLAEFGAEATVLAPQGIRIPPIPEMGRHPNVQAEPAFQQGFFEVQDEGSQLAALLTGAEPGETVLDFCAGAGGKTLALAAAMENSGRIAAFDAEKPRLAPIFERLRRSGVENVEVVSRVSELDDLRQAADLVVVDAPCTGSGTWRRRPDAKWRLSRRQLDARVAEQAEILDAAAHFVRPGGRLAYITCSVFAEENERQTADFLARSGAFRAADHGLLWETALGSGKSGARIDASGIRLSPASTATDGFYFCLLHRSA